MNFMMEAKSVCKKHPYNNPQQGVCSSCLAEKLSKLTSGSTPCCNYPTYNSHMHAKSTQVGAASSSYSPPSINPSGHVSPPRVIASHTRRHRGSDSAAGLKKSRSMIVYASRKSGTTSDGAAGSGRSTGKMTMKKTGGFWAKLMCSTGKITSKDVFTHSRSATCQHRFVDLS